MGETRYSHWALPHKERQRKHSCLGHWVQAELGKLLSLWLSSIVIASSDISKATTESSVATGPLVPASKILGT